MYYMVNLGQVNHLFWGNCQQLKTKNTSTIIYLPEFIRTLKSGFKDGTFETKLAKVQEVNILMLDDIGAEEIHRG